jgi:hypothetical protein
MPEFNVHKYTLLCLRLAAECRGRADVCSRSAWG